jgi:hypothetical protein
LNWAISACSSADWIGDEAEEAEEEAEEEEEARAKAEAAVCSRKTMKQMHKRSHGCCYTVDCGGYKLLL